MITLDASEMTKLVQGMAKYQNALPKSMVVKALRESARPMLRSAQQLAPVATDTTTRRGGATKRDLRIKIGTANGEEIARIFIGVSQKTGKVGWRTHFITHGYTDRGGTFHRKRDFLQEAYDYTFETVQDNFYRLLFDGFIKWGKDNLPQ